MVAPCLAVGSHSSPGQSRHHDGIDPGIVIPKFTLTSDEREDLLGDYLPWCETVTVPNKIKLADWRDRFDRPFLAIALTAKADALITGDKDLLALSRLCAVPILTPAAFRDRMQAQARK